MPSPKPDPLILTPEERAALAALGQQRMTSQALALRARIVLACADGATVTRVAADLEVTRDTVRKWRDRFLRGRLDRLADMPRSGAPRTITDEQVELVITKALTEPGPRPGTRWSTRSMAAATGMSPAAVARIWRASGLGPRGDEPPHV
jgi:transposase